MLRFQLASLCVLALCTAPVLAQDPAPADPLAGVNIMRVEEDWVLDIADPDPAADCPQISTVFGPSDPALGIYCLFELNHGTVPEYFKGGMQLQVWWQDALVGYQRQFAPTQLSLAIERITYTTVTRIDINGDLDMFVKNGKSLTWGDFGESASLWIEVPTYLTNLNNYNPANSVQHSKVGYGANRVNNFVRTEVRYYTVDGLHYTDSTDAVIHHLVGSEDAPPPIN